MMCRISILVVSLLMLSGSAWAFLPPDASAREPQIRAYRQKVREKYEERQIERQAQAIRAYEQTRADVFTPPWMRGQSQASVGELGGTLTSVSEQEKKRNHRFWVSIVLLIALGAVAGWIRYATRDTDQ